jgi:hypothetical protein
MHSIGKTSLVAGGIGKTDLSIKLAKEIQDNFDYIIRRKLTEEPPVKDILSDCIKFFSNQDEVRIPDKQQESISRLIYHLKKNRCLIVLDNVESILQKKTPLVKFRKKYKGYGKLFKAVGTCEHKSCMLLTTREVPQKITLLEGRRKPVRVKELKGLSVLNGRKVFEEIGEFTASDEEWTKIINIYGGNPLALELAAKHIKEIFSGNISRFLKENSLVFGDINDLIDWHFKRLTDLEKEIMFWFSINREPTSLEDLKEDILSPQHNDQTTTTLQTLQRRLPIERTDTGFTLQPVLMEYTTKRLVEKIHNEIKKKQVDFLNNYSLVKASAKDYVRESQNRTIINKIIERLSSTLGKDIEQHLKDILDNWRKDSPMKPGYLSGNILNILTHLKNVHSGETETKPLIDLSAFDFSHLEIRQAYLQGVDLHDVNFSHSEFEKCIFTETLGINRCVTFSRDGQYLAVASDKEIRLWRLSDYKQKNIYKGHKNLI